MGLTRVADISRYGSVESDVDGVVTRFFPAGVGQGRGLINAGIYGAARSLIGLIPPGTASSFERDVLPVLAGQGLRGVALDGFFIDIGVPDSYQQLAADPGPLLRAMDAGRMCR
jgi:D-glycero-D-manno-heptose 1,7-bisphosphate phosphatase